jgi:2-dehydro-3-deoxyphosphogluconate aldolase/(4S)-4-hydroxy-2-oxoglutarate aldolase
MSDVVDTIGSHRLIAILRAETAELAVGLAHAAYDGGLRVIEITFTVPEAPKVINELDRELGDAIIGAGTVLDVASVKAAAKAGARFIVAPNIDPEVIETAKTAGVCVCPGGATPTEVAHARKLGADLVKVFPASFLGGPEYLRALLQPMPDLRLVPTGGIGPEDVVTYLRAGAFAVGVGSALFYRELATPADALAIAARARGLLERVGGATI